jgi:hypothetical protein
MPSHLFQGHWLEAMTVTLRNNGDDLPPDAVLHITLETSYGTLAAAYQERTGGIAADAGRIITITPAPSGPISYWDVIVNAPGRLMIGIPTVNATPTFSFFFDMDVTLTFRSQAGEVVRTPRLSYPSLALDEGQRLVFSV